MNNLLQLTGQFHLNANSGRGFHPNIGKNIITWHNMSEFAKQLTEICDYWKKENLLAGALFSVHYKRVVPKTKRISYLLKQKKIEANDTIVGAKFDDNGRHVITHFVDLAVVEKMAVCISQSAAVIKEYYPDGFSQDNLDQLSKKGAMPPFHEMKKSAFIGTIIDVCEVDNFDIDEFKMPAEFKEYVVTFYQTGKTVEKLLHDIGIDVLFGDKVFENVYVLDRDELLTVVQYYPYLVSQAVTNFNGYEKETDERWYEKDMVIPQPSNEPVIGVLDTSFDEEAYFSDWVEVVNSLPEGVEIHQKDKKHGTYVSSIIVDGPALNPRLEDHCGRFRVKHFCVATEGRFNASLLANRIESIVKNNLDIKVWNLSLGSPLSVSRNYISPIGSILDNLQAKYNVVFVVAGTNLSGDHPNEKRIGAPADSLNSIVVNSVNFNGEPASYTRTGPVLSFFHKPDVCYYGGDADDPITVFGTAGLYRTYGTSFAAPWITRKVAYLIYRMKFTKEIAKALILDSAAGWSAETPISDKKGYGIVPIRIEDVIESKDDEIRFILKGNIEDYETYTYSIPVPSDNHAFPYYARATLCYYPECSRAQGVDYTGTEMDFKFGRVRINKKGKTEIASINRNRQTMEDNYTYEMDARRLFRKWDNVKRMTEEIKDRAVPRKVYEEGMWGLSIISKDRLKMNNKYGLQFGIVITLKEMYGKNRINEFIKLCSAKAWLVDEIDLNAMNKLYNIEEEEVEFD